MAKAKFPAKLYVYEIKERDATYLAVANGLEEIPEDQDGEAVATYGLHRQSKFKLKRDLV
jgi:hypothetical protein